MLRNLLATLLVTGLTATGLPAAAAPATGRPKTSPTATLGSDDARRLAEAKASGRPAVTVLVATGTGRATAVAGRLERLGASVSRTVDRLGYVLAKVPTGAVLDAARLDGVVALDLDSALRRPDPADGLAGGPAAARESRTGPGPKTPADNPYLPAGETGAVEFIRAHPSYDGRGVTIGIMDSGVDVDHPALQRTTTGERKIVDSFTATDPLEDATWLRMNLTVSGPEFEVGGARFTAPAGRYAFNWFYESTTKSSGPAGDVNRDGDTTDAFGVLYDPETHDVRVDADRDKTFADEPVMRPYRERYDIGHFGTDDPKTEVIDRMAFTVEYREDVAVAATRSDFVNIGIPESDHGTHVAGIAAGNDLMGNTAFDGAAPGAKIVSGRACTWGGSCTYAALTDGVVDMVVNRRVDIVNMSIGGLSALNDGRNAWVLLYDRLITDYGVQLFISAGNSGPGVNTVGDPSTAGDAVSVGSTISRETWAANYGSTVSAAYSVHPFSSRGPREDGGLKPNLVAPGAAISSIPTWQNGAPVAQAGYTLPAGYAMMQGTSMASPQATGAASLLLSAARAGDRGLTPAQLRRALYTSARYLPGTQALAQGYGLIDVPAAWKLLWRDLETRTYTAVAPVCTALSDLIGAGDVPLPGRGSGIHNRCPAGEGGHRPWEWRAYPVTLTRTSGPAGPVEHRIGWIGNDGTFSAPRTVTLPLNRPVTVTAGARPSDGLHSAIMTVDDPATPVVDFEVFGTVIAAAQVSAPGYAFAADGRIERNATRSYFVEVPEGAETLQVNLSGLAAGSQTRFVAIDPYGVPADPTATTACYPHFEPVSTCAGIERDYRDPLSGIWEIEVEVRRTSPMLVNPYRIAAAVQGVEVTPAESRLGAVKVGAVTPLSWDVRNRLGPVRVVAQGGPLGTVSSKRPSVKNGESTKSTLTVPVGATRLDVSIGGTSDAGADLDLFLYRGDSTTPLASSADGDSEESVSVPDPEPGEYRVVVEGYSVPTGETAFDYRDAYFSPRLGSLAVSGDVVRLEPGGTAKVSGSLTVASSASDGRALTGEMSVVTDQGAVVGIATVTLG
ncbi:S8 family serine peptidase [Catenuloplanes atrovinosus]|uniref:Subtilisin family serine protease n=1 Tax=Catenuloplanes atrovinosus TaxID=137266 RepID=A0AAE3YXT2_9ACTN|nr:S8 family serine peptidase [Catenuloplanes atrovinosus]MDR7280368.1 subtilisin family serine protease [Catenuloplanes atrovinosus]